MGKARKEAYEQLGNIQGLSMDEKINLWWVYMNAVDIKWVGQVYSSKTKSWKTIEHCADLLFCGREGVFAGGKLYWTSFNGHKEDIIFFDLKSEVFGRIELPFDQEKYGFCSVGSIGGFLCVLSCNYERGVRVWVMESWEKVVTLDRLLELLQPPPLLVGVKGEILVNCGSTVLVYECQDNVVRSLKYCSCCWNSVFTKLDDCVRSISERVYVESLVSPQDL
ncbi:F-box protein CPR1-like [Salvia miltiorrhiza]|uniref:F-box protein CPR1-like n=1 Tax=Salvia miltiorrhiza TaxID=226208 RepID=UPI0025AD03D8|nr:F-box protein CPR1-like [Salvia miltiorrhiza]